jgi:hypothetical protein
MIETEDGRLARHQRFEERILKSKNTAMTWAAVLLWGAVSLIIDTIPSVNASATLDGGTIFAMGAGIILLISGLAIMSGAEPRRGMMFRFILGLIFLGIGVGEFTDLNDNIVVAAVLAFIATTILVNTFKKRA